MSSDPIAAVLQTLKDFFTEARVVVRHPWTFPERLGLNAENLFGKGTAFVVLASAVAYLMCVPVFMRHDMAVSKGVLVLLHIVGLYVVGVALHLGLKLMGSRGVTLKETLGLYGYQLGTQVVGFTLLMYPSFLAYKQVARLGIAGQTQEEMALPVMFGLNFLAVLLIGLAWVFAAMAPMYARYHHLARWGKTRVAVAFVLALTTTWPFLSWSIPWLHKVGKFL
jgi:hypothetical protein